MYDTYLSIYYSTYYSTYYSNTSDAIWLLSAQKKQLLYYHSNHNKLIQVLYYSMVQKHYSIYYKLL